MRSLLRQNSPGVRLQYYTILICKKMSDRQLSDRHLLTNKLLHIFLSDFGTIFTIFSPTIYVVEVRKNE